jgi:Na+-translocating ferredoxin:NAD+ oxidoreductase RnfG subunit
VKNTSKYLFDKRRKGIFCLFSLFILSLWSISYAEQVFEDPNDFINKAFDGKIPESEFLWLKEEQKAKIKKILGHDYSSSRIRYWKNSTRTLWILDEIGKVKPITTGVIIEDGKIKEVKVLIYRESHGWEVCHPFFTNQFVGTEIDKDNKLNKEIDGISGATLSVNALKRMSRLALLFNNYLMLEK